MSDEFRRRLAQTAGAVEDLLSRFLSGELGEGEISRPPRLLAAMRHAILGGGKRLRPHLVVETARLFGRNSDGVLRAAAAVECVHAYSLVHDDLPAMDDDDLRHGRATVHRAFDEATAILAGDTLLTLAFDILAEPTTAADPSTRINLVHALARAAGIGGMAGGQMLDLEAEGRFAADGRPLVHSETEVLRLQAMKTGAILAAAIDMGAIVGEAGPDERQALATYGGALGQAFQIADDLLDVEAEAEAIGKATGKDAAKGKATLVSLMGVAAARQRLNQLVGKAEAALAHFGSHGDVLRATARFVAERKS
jgi:farnesyl diphosphate synthase